MVTVNQIAKDLGVCTKTIYRRIWNGEIPVQRISHNCVRVTDEDYAKFKESLKQPVKNN